MITQISEHLGFKFKLEEDRLVEGRNKVDLYALVHQGIIFVDSNTNMMMIHNNIILDLPYPRKVRVDIVKIWLYQTNAHTSGNSSEEEGDPDLIIKIDGDGYNRKFKA